MSDDVVFLDFVCFKSFLFVVVLKSGLFFSGVRGRMLIVSVLTLSCVTHLMVGALFLALNMFVIVYESRCLSLRPH